MPRQTLLLTGSADRMWTTTTLRPARKVYTRACLKMELWRGTTMAMRKAAERNFWPSCRKWELKTLWLWYIFGIIICQEGIRRRFTRTYWREGRICYRFCTRKLLRLSIKWVLRMSISNNRVECHRISQTKLHQQWLWGTQEVRATRRRVCSCMLSPKRTKLAASVTVWET